MQVTDKMVEAFVATYERETFHRYDCDAIRAALTAALAHYEAEAQPVGWQTRKQYGNQWTPWTEVPEDTAIHLASLNQTNIQIRPLYTALTHREVEEAVVKPLEWTATKEIRRHLVEGTDVVEYVSKGEFRYTLTKNYQIGSSWDATRGQYTPINQGTCVSFESAKAAAQADYERRILSALIVPPVVPSGMVLVPVEQEDKNEF